MGGLVVALEAKDVVLALFPLAIDAAALLFTAPVLLFAALAGFLSSDAVDETLETEPESSSCTKRFLNRCDIDRDRAKSPSEGPGWFKLSDVSTFGALAARFAPSFGDCAGDDAVEDCDPAPEEDLVLKSGISGEPKRCLDFNYRE